MSRRKAKQVKAKKTLVSSAPAKRGTSAGPLRVGFDLDGVILANPIRIFRGFIATGKKMGLIPRRELEFYIPRSPLEKKLWLYLHKSSWRLADGFPVLQRLVAEGKVEAYVISGRFACLAKDSQGWIEKINALNTFQGIYFNQQDEQPHLFKARMIEELQLAYFVEDNFDIANYLAKQLGKTKVWWLSNFVDAHINFAHKFASFEQVMKGLTELLSNDNPAA